MNNITLLIHLAIYLWYGMRYRGHDYEGEPHAVLRALKVVVADVAVLSAESGREPRGRGGEGG